MNQPKSAVPVMKEPRKHYDQEKKKKKKKAIVTPEQRKHDNKYIQDYSPCDARTKETRRRIHP